MKYTLEDFKNKKIAVWVRNEEEYAKFRDFVGDEINWANGKSIDKYTPSIPCEIVASFIFGDGMAHASTRGFHSYKCPSKFKSVTVDDLDLELEIKIKEAAAAKEIAENLVNYVIEASNKGELTSTHQIVILEAVKWVLQK